MLTSKQRAFLRSKATALTTSFQIGKGGVNENMLKSIEAALLAHELVKVKCLENCEYTPKEALEGIAAALEAEEVQVVGNKFILFKVSPEKRKYDLVNLCEIEEKKEKSLPRKRSRAPKKSEVRQTRAERPERSPHPSALKKALPKNTAIRSAKEKADPLPKASRKRGKLYETGHLRRKLFPAPRGSF
jgi:RNA-binding protein